MPGLALRGGVSYVGKPPVDNANHAYSGGVTTLSLGARHTTRIAGKRTTLQAVLDNATDKDYWSTAGNGFIGICAPRNLKLTAKREF